MRNGGDWEGLTERNDEQAEMGTEQQYAISEILNDLDEGKRLTTGQMLLLRWFCGVPAPIPPKEQMAVWDGESDPF